MLSYQHPHISFLSVDSAVVYQTVLQIGGQREDDLYRRLLWMIVILA